MKILKHRKFKNKKRTPENVNTICHGLGLALTTVKMSVLLKENNGSNTTSIESTMTFFTEIEKQFKIHVEAQNTLDSQNDSGLVEKLRTRDNTGVTILFDFNLYNSPIVMKAAWQLT